MNAKTEPFKISSAYYDLLYKDKDYRAECSYVNNLISKYNPGATAVIELGSGTGTYSKLLSELGFSITGIELECEMNAIAIGKKIPNFSCVTSDITQFNLNKEYEVALALFHVISYLNTNEQLISCFKQVSKHLRKNGVFIFDVWFSPAVYHLRPVKRVKNLENEKIELIRHAEPVMFFDKNVVKVNYKVSVKSKMDGQVISFSEEHNMRHYSTPEIMLIAGLAGMEIVAAEEFLTGNEPSDETWGVCYILQKL